MPQNKPRIPQIGEEVSQDQFPAIGEEVPQDSPVGGGGRSVGGFIGNAISGLAGGVKGLAMLPWQLANMPKAVGENIANLITRGELKPGVVDSVKNLPEAVWNNYANAYGGWDKFTNTMYEDPVRVLGDLSMLATGGGMGVLRLAPKGSALANVGRAAVAAGDAANPMNVITKGAGMASRPLRRWAEGAAGSAYAPPKSMLDQMAESRGMSRPELKRMLGRDSLDMNAPPTEATAQRMLSGARAGVTERQAMEKAARGAGRSVDYGVVAKNTVQGTLSRVPEGGEIPRIRATPMPVPTVEATKGAMREAFTQHPDLTVPVETWRSSVAPTETLASTLPPADASLLSALKRGDSFGARLERSRVNSAPRVTGEPMLEGINITHSNVTPSARVPNPELDVPLAGQVYRTTSSDLAGAFGRDATEKAAIATKRSIHHNLGQEIDAATAGLPGVTMGPGTRSWADSAAETHKMMNLVEAIDAKYSTAANPVKLYEAIGATTGNPIPIVLGAAGRPGVKWRFGHGLDNVGKFANGLDSEAMTRALLLARMQQNAVEPR